MLDERIQGISINAGFTMLMSIKRMDELDRKSLLVFDDNRFLGVLSIGDIQRAIIQNLPMDTVIQAILRTKITVAKDSDSPDYIRKLMLEVRAECMPVLDENGNLVDVYFWEDQFPSSVKNSTALSGIPVVIMAGGFGSRLKPLTNIIPKALVPIGEKPIIEMIVDGFNELGVADFFFSVNYKHEMIQYHFENLEDKNYTISYFKEEKPLGTAGSLFLLKGKIQTAFFVSNCDILIRQDYSEIYDYHVQNSNDITVVGSLKHTKIPYGIIETKEGGELISIQEKPEFTYLINSGMYVLNSSVLDQIPENKFLHITDLIEQIKKTGGKIGVFPVSEKSWFDIGEWQEYQKTIDFFDQLNG